VTPPVGLQLYIASSIARVPIDKVVVWPFVAVMLAVVLLMVFIPGIATWLPSVLL
jgi:C4-dicarboxylate transporter DctM subunit